ncbi:MAG: mannose-1-phosphate guanylyltransferase/mannose-6-phosphate isomerase [Deferribacteres bacterium]|nr:mannose-1-phosphate guanylyltransferase/mannose-6-phosphate isomerase [Deferribacteres bacterium]
MKAVILSGGEGTRLFPLSRESFPKQFVKLNGKSLLEKTFERCLTVCDRKEIFISTNEKYVFLVKDTLGEDVNVITEPAARNTAPAILYAIKNIKADESEVIAFCPSDHEIYPTSAFAEDMKKAEELASKGYIVLFGIRPSKPETGYGYIKKGEPIESAYKAEEFREKPSFEEAKRFVESNQYLWNSGIYVARADTFLNEFKKVADELSPFVDHEPEQLKKEFEKLPSISIDYAVAERSSKLVVLPASFNWSDVGSWDSLYELYPKDEKGNAVKGDVFAVDTANSFIAGDKRLVITLGIEDIVVADTPDVVLIAKRGHTQKVKDVVNALKKMGKKEAVEHTVSYRPWGSFEVLLKGERFKVKRVKVKPGKKLSLQLHHHRAEHWIVVKGTARITIGDKTFYLHENESAYVPKSTVHRIENVGKIPLEIIEIQTGEYLEEDDIIRLEDDWERR